MEFEEDGEELGFGGGGGVEALGEGEIVNGIDAVEEVGGAAGFIALKMADEVERGVEIGESGALFLPLLNAIFAEVAKAEGEGGADGFGGESLGDGDKGDVFGLAGGFCGGTSDAGADAFEILRERGFGRHRGENSSTAALC